MYVFMSRWISTAHIPILDTHAIIAVNYHQSRISQRGGFQVRPDQDAILEKLYRAYFHALEVHAYRYLGSWEDSHAAAQEAFHIACEKIDVLMKAESQIGWLKNTVKNVCRHMIRERNRQALLFSSLDDLTDADLPSVSDDTGGQPTDMLDGLISQEEIALLKRVIVDGAPYSEVARELDCSIWTCRKRVQRTIGKLHKKYREKFGKDFSL